MKDLILQPSQAIPKGKVRLPASKSVSNRLLILQRISGGAVTGEGLSKAGDTQVLQRALTELEGAYHRIDLADAGTAMRFFTALAATVPGSRELTGTERMCERPIGPLVEALRAIGASIEYLGKEGYPPLLVEGRGLKGGNVRLRADVSSQFLSALALIAPATEQGVELLLHGDPVSAPYFRITLSLLARLGVPVEEKDKSVRISAFAFPSRSLKVEADHSSAAFWYELLALKGKGALFLEGLQEDSSQGDRDTPLFFRGLGIQERWEEGGCWIEAVPGRFETGPYEADMQDHPDLVPALSVTLAALGRPALLHGVASLRSKESDRLEALRIELLRMGVESHPKGDQLGIDPEGLDLSVHPHFDEHGDHRIAMALAPLIPLLPGLSIKEPDVVRKSYPEFWEELESVLPGVLKNA